MQTLQVVQRNFNSFGLSPNREPINRTILIVLILGFLGISMQWIFFFHGANSPQELMETIYVVTACTGIFLSFTSTIFTTTGLFSFINSFDELTNERKWNSNHWEALANKVTFKIRIKNPKIEGNLWKDQSARWKV